VISVSSVSYGALEIIGVIIITKHVCVLFDM